MGEIAPVNAITQLRAAMEKGIADGSFEVPEAPLEHYQIGDLYGRRMRIAADSTFVTKVHKTNNFLIALQGHASVMNEKGEAFDIIAPQVLITEPGTLRVVYTHTDIDWFTAHICPETNPEAREKFLACDSMDEYNALQLEAKA
jgi:hypothetical protein